MGTFKLDSSLLCAHTYNLHLSLCSPPGFLVSELWLYLMTTVVRVQIYQHYICSHPAHVRVQIDYCIAIVDVTSKVQAASIVLK